MTSTMPANTAIRSLTQWLSQILGNANWSVKTRQRGNTLQILIEGESCPQKQEVLKRLITACLDQDFTHYIPPHHAPIYRFLVYGRQLGTQAPQWQAPLYLNQLQKHLAIVSQSEERAAPPSGSIPALSSTPPSTSPSTSPFAPQSVSTQTIAPHGNNLATATPQTAGLHTKNLQIADLHTIDPLVNDPSVNDPPVNNSPVNFPVVNPGTSGRSTFPQPTRPNSVHTTPTEADIKAQSETQTEAQTDTQAPSKTPSALESTPPPHTDRPGGNIPLIVSNRSLASQGDPEAIAHYLSETFNGLGIAVQVQAKGLSKGNSLSPISPLGQVQRLQVVCESPYSLDAAILTEPLSQQLRDLDLRGFRDAVVISRVAGEVEVDWVLRVDLTPSEEILRDLARWGDTIALGALVDRHLVNLQVKTEVELKDKTLHLFCKSQSNPPVAPHQREVMDILRPLLQSLAPQGIHASMVYGLRPHLTPTLEQSAPLWVDWLGLPAAQHPDLACTTRELADAGDLEAVSFLINRLLNPDLKAQLSTGGIRVYVRRKVDLVHVMCDAPTCPRQGEVGLRVVNLIRQLRLPHIAGVRVYGRQSGQKAPLWCQGVDFIPRKRDVPEATPEFAASVQHLGDVLAVSPEALNLDLEELDQERLVTWSTALLELREGIRQGLMATQLFLSAEQDPSQGSGVDVPWGKSLGTIATWGALGVLGTLMLDWCVGAGLHRLVVPEISLEPGLAPEQIEARLAAVDSEDPLADTPADFGISPQRSGNEFTEWGTEPLPFETAARVPELPVHALGHRFTASTNYPSFNNQLLDQKMKLLQTHLLQQGVPDILIVGSSRALRGIDPLVLQQQLQRLGYPNLQILNLAVNGATAQVVDFQLRQLIPPDYLPQLIIWADGARAFNSGRTDITYNAIRASEAYQEITLGQVPNLLLPLQTPETETALVEPDPKSAQPRKIPAPDQWNRILVDYLGSSSSVYEQRDHLKEWIVAMARLSLPQAAMTTALENDGTREPLNLDPMDPEFSTIADAPQGEGQVDEQGFVALSTRFSPATYYQKYARVSGDYDRDYENFQTDGDQQAALESLLNYSQTQRIPVVFVNLPLTREYLDPIRWDYEQEFQSDLYQLQADGKLLLRNLVDLWPDALEYFSDPSHLNRYGAESVSLHLAEDPLIPWPSQSNADRFQSAADAAERIYPTLPESSSQYNTPQILDGDKTIR